MYTCTDTWRSEQGLALPEFRREKLLDRGFGCLFKIQILQVSIIQQSTCFTGMSWLLLLQIIISRCSFLSRPCGEYHKHVGTDGESISLLLLHFQVWGGSLL